jgi:hypothetical protein
LIATQRALVLVLALAACGDPPDVASDLFDRLAALPGVTVEPRPTATPGYDYFVLRFTQPVDHADPGGPTFQQRVSLIHRRDDAPMIVLTTGYDDYYQDYPYELTGILAANQISIEHRYFGESRPDPADWTKLTIEQMARDQHAIVAALRGIFDTPFLSTGGSKGGMTATYHRRFFPDDVDGTVPYVAPLSLGAPDPRYASFVAQIGPASCRDALRAVATEMLQNRRTAMEQRAAAQPGHSYTRIPLGPAVEGSIASLEWAFWQYKGVRFCDGIPPPTASDDALFDFLDTVSSVADNDDAQIARFEAYYYQAYAQLGFPASNATYLEPFLRYSDRDYDGALPTPEVPAYDAGEAMQDIASYIETRGDRLLFVYGEWDPWTGGQYELGDAADSIKLVQPQGSHGARLGGLTADDRAAAYARLAAWTGLDLRPPPSSKPALSHPVLREPRVPPAMLRAARRR